MHTLVAGWRQVPAVRTVPPCFADPNYLDALTDVARRSLADCDWQPDRYIVSFYGLPQRYADLGGPYPQHCERTAEVLAERLGWPRDRVILSQSRGEREVWLKPYTDETLLELAVICPGFVALKRSKGSTSRTVSSSSRLVVETSTTFRASTTLLPGEAAWQQS